MKIKAIITGATGMVGEGVLLECLQNPAVENVLVINRKPGGVSHPKLKEVIHGDFFNLAVIEPELQGYNSCYFCLGTSSVGLSKEEYKKITQDLTLNFAETLRKINPDMTFIYITGAGTDSSEKGSLNWANVKGATENALLKMFKNAYMFRPAMMKALEGQKNLKLSYRSLEWIYPIGRKFWPGGFCTLKEVAQAMIYLSINGSANHIIEVKDMVALAAMEKKT